MSLATFARNFLDDYKGTAAIVPSSRSLANAMVEPLRGKPLRVAVEFGPGTGVVTSELLNIMPDDGILLAFEISPRFVAYLRDTCSDQRLQIVQAGAETASDRAAPPGNRSSRRSGLVSRTRLPGQDVGGCDFPTTLAATEPE